MRTVTLLSELCLSALLAAQTVQGADGLYHGECVALGMLPMCSPEVWERLEKVLRKLSLPVTCGADAAQVMEAVLHDKKASGNTITAIRVDKAGSFTEQKMTPDELKARYTAAFGKERKA